MNLLPATHLSDPYQALREALANYDRLSVAHALQQAEAERNEVQKRFPLDTWPMLPKERYALGVPDSENTYCRWLEFRTPHLGSIRGGSSRKLILYKHRDKPGWFIAPPGYDHEDGAWTAIRGAFVEAFHLASEQRWEAIDDLKPLHYGSALLLKSLHVYFPQDILPISSRQHLQHFLALLGVANPGGVVTMNRTLLAALRAIPECSDWSPLEMEKFLYHWADPRDRQVVVKIAPGDGAKFWDECLAGNYICVGWDEMGDLREYESEEAFMARFRELYTAAYDGNASTTTRKARELWTLRDLEPGDRIVANKGIRQVLAVGTVVEPAYEWRGERQEHRHTVKVQWDTSVAKEVLPQRRWGVTTVAPVPAPLFQTIIGSNRQEVAPLVIDPLTIQIQQALDGKGQAILYGPPGTGKTYNARRFAVSWLLAKQGRTDAQAILGNFESFRAEEAALSAAKANRRMWWMVAKADEWSWSELFETGSVEYRYGRIKRNYAHVQPGDLVVGYQSSPDKRIVALARVSNGLAVREGDAPTIQLAPLAKVSQGLTYDELKADPILSASEPMRFRNQGTLFALSETEAQHLADLLLEREPHLVEFLDEEQGVGALTCLTFHPTYSYEDFVEGFRPVKSDHGGMALRLEDGVFKRVCREAQANPDKPYLLLIDEINRANLAKVFGELITLLEKDKRGLVVTLPQSKETFSVPPNVYVIGTMNTADRSIKLMDAALRRRFAFVELLPDPTLLEGGELGGLALDRFLEKLNRRIAKHEGREKQIGHSFLLEDGQPVSSPEEFARRFRQEILPLLQEYCYDDYGTLARYLGDGLIDHEAQCLNTEKLYNDEKLISALVEAFEVEQFGDE